MTVKTPLQLSDVVVDRTLDDSFPASDPPSWTTGVTRPAPAPVIPAVAREAGPRGRVLQKAAVQV